jgi:NAD(P)-dependent dehydrogenase (short-subunit alcohol dehydrogenase family)
MKVFVAGATGAIGRPLIQQLVASGHDVTGTTRSERKTALIEEAGARAVVLDILDADAVGQAVSKAEPDAIVHQATALAGGIDLRHFDRTFGETNRLRTEGADNLLSAARAAGATRFVAQSFSAWARTAERIGGLVFHPRRMNGAPGAVTMTPDGRVISVLVLEIAAGRIQAVRGVVNPDKLAHLGRVADVNALLRGEG